MKWEYHIIKLDAHNYGEFNDVTLNNQINGLGQKGWELVSGFSTNKLEGASRHVVLIFKRPQSE